ncbi:hypothetical protein COU59_02655 [Candidatus Pacearchaeota archaeon CG10_big_fil_rev_8_21_14_0_10_34_12]|nr:MAG: hypothetical protein COU59_02655 [Candidatus Pacearchaeota archaeon CG10_big_fil_rev_8_21_14_0_10_34_12]
MRDAERIRELEDVLGLSARMDELTRVMRIGIGTFDSPFGNESAKRQNARELLPLYEAEIFSVLDTAERYQDIPSIKTAAEIMQKIYSEFAKSAKHYLE